MTKYRIACLLLWAAVVCPAQHKNYLRPVRQADRGMRGAIAAQAESVFEKYVEAGFHHMWEEPKKMDDPDVLGKALTASGLDAAKLFARAQEPEIKNKLLENTQAAVARGAFGSPTFFVGDEMFFGKEQLREVEELIAGR